MVTSTCLYFLEKFDELYKSVAFGEIEVFYRPALTEVMNLKMNWKYFQIQNWMLQTDGVICVVFMFPSWVMILKLSVNLMNGGSDPYKPYHFLKDCKKIFRSIYVNCFNILRFLAEVSAKLQKMHFFGQFKDCNLWRKHGN